MTKRPGWRPAHVYVPERADLVALSERLTQYMAGPRLAPSSVKSYEWCLRAVEAWCRRRGLPSFPMPPQVLGAWLAAALHGTARTGAVGEPAAEDDGAGAPEPLSMSTVDQTWAAIVWQHRSRRAASPTDDPWAQTVRRGLRRALAGHRVRKAPPLSPDDVRALVAVEPSWTPTGLAERALLLSAVCWDVPLSQLAVVPPTALELISPTRASFTCAGRTFTVDCAGDAGCGVDCLFCALWACADLIPAGAPYLFGVQPADEPAGAGYRVRTAAEPLAQQTWARRVAETRARSGRGCWPIGICDGKIIVREPVAADAALLAGLRRGLALSTSTDGLMLLQQRAGLLLSWHRGLRSDDLRRRRRGALQRNEKGYRLTIESAKGTHAAVVLGVRPAQDPRLDAVAALDDWLAVLDAAAAGTVAADELPLVVRCPRGANLTFEAVTYNWMWRHFAALQARAGLSGFTLHSTRTGFAVTAADGKATADQLRRVMRQKKVNTAVGYVLSRAAASRPAPLALARAAAAAGAA
ncbi:hypothetical protein [Geodermatophilus sabuli]|uniref:Phage integrase family protein n=1 Tax=Geodermatophilus sabuli TaxID=1564158 RepID=A0A285EBZ8_9ACTN|nr:hypothetical protein [Geodermatophilus sabuli]MBB3084218.1 hypothetical protein [Geodermatophilus sabuli]SNX96510.1 hypothetical protein SAMN06893097_104225 [Geodermatophilus sabuli]